jgi:hypothetical protein
MKKIILSLFACTFYLLSFSQDAPKADSRVESYFGKTKIQQWVQQNPDSISYYNFFVGHSFEVTKGEYLQNKSGLVDAKNLNLSETDAQVLTTKPSEFNILSLNLSWDLDKTIYFLIDGTEYCLVLHPLSYINQKFQARK